jgi:hypothetical protein
MWEENKHQISIRKNRVNYFIGSNCEELVYGHCEKKVRDPFIIDYKCSAVYGRVRNPHERLGIRGIPPFKYRDQLGHRLRDLDPEGGLTIYSIIVPDEVSRRILNDEGFVDYEIKKGKVFWEAVYVGRR